MSKFDGVDVSPNMKRLQRIFINQMKEAMQQYMNESSTAANGVLEGFNYLKPSDACDLFNDFLLYTNDGQPLDDSQKVKS